MKINSVKIVLLIFASSNFLFCNGQFKSEHKQTESQALEIGKKFCEEGAVKFINGVLDSVNKELRAKESIEGIARLR